MEEADIAGFRVSPVQRQTHQLAAWVQAAYPLPAATSGVGCDPDRLAAAVRQVRHRHEALRTRVRSATEHQVPVQVIDEADHGLDAVVDRVDAPPAGSAHDGDPLLRILAAERDQIDLEQGPAARITLVHCHESPVLVLTGHAAVTDDESLRIVAAEIIAAYQGRPLPEVAVQYADFAAWHHDLLADAQGTTRRAYWEPHRDPAVALALQDLLADTGVTGPWQVDSRTLSPTTCAAMRSVATATTTTPGAVAATAWAVLLWRIAGERDVLCDLLLPGRAASELRRAVGPYARQAPVVCRFAAGTSWPDAVAQVHRILLDAAEHVDDLQPAATPAARRAPVFEWVHHVDQLDGGAADRTVDDPPPPLAAIGRVGAPVALRLTLAPDGVRVHLGYDSGRLPPPAAATLLDRFRVVLDRLVGEDAPTVDAVSLLLPGEAQRLRTGRSGPTTVPTGAATLHDAIASQAARTPLAVAVDDGVHRLTYERLDKTATALAVRLAAAGAGAGQRVLVRTARGAELVVALLAVTKTGAAYVPVDLGQPAKRVRFVAEDVDARLAVLGPDTATEDLPPQVHPVRLDLTAPGPERVGAEPAVGRGSDIAYVMYTSGSTGAPNGVPVTHYGLLNYLSWAAQAYRLGDGSGTVVHTSAGFDLTLTALLGPLLVGQRCRLVPDGPGLAGLVAVLRDEPDVTLLKLTPSQLDALLAVIPAARLAAQVRTLVLGGEPLRAEQLADLRAQPAGITIVNEYGPTETVVGSCAYQIHPDTPASGPVPLGDPIAGTRIHLLDRFGAPVPDGAVGEIVIAGAGVADGYLNRPELTRRRFVTDPADPTARAYRTGDHARRDAAGQLIFLGRTDDQLKVRGYRIEPGEVETVLAGHPQVVQAAVAAGSAPGEPSRNHLVAYVVVAPAAAVSSADLVAYCRQRLPEYLVPADFRTVAHLPLTSNGKLDRAALAAQATVDPEASSPYLAPRTETEEILAGAIAAVLRRDRVGVDDNYFTIGGDSIRSVMVASRAQARGVAVTVADLHRWPTVRALAQEVTGQPMVAEPATAPYSLISAEDRELMSADVEDAFPLNLLQEGMIFHRDFAAKSAVYHAIASVRLTAPLDVDTLRTVIRQLVERHPMLRTSFDQTTFSRPLQLVHRGFPDPLSYADLRGLTPDEQQRHIEAWVDSEKQRGFELEEYPLIRFMVQRLDDATFQFTYGFHHEIVDGWSEALMVTELFGHYFSIIFGESWTPAPPRSTMRDAVALEIEALRRPANITFWSEYLRDATLMRLPRLNAAPTADKGAREIVRIAVPISTDLSDRLKRLALDHAVPLKSVLLAGHLAVMNHYHGQPDTLTYTVTNGRPEQADGSTAIGLFVNSLAVRVAMTGGTWLELIADTLASERRSLPYRRLPMAELKRHQGNEPLAETLFFFTDYHVFRELDRWRARGIEHVATELYGESTFPFCAIFRLNRDNGQLEIRIEYDNLQFDAELMDQMAQDYQRVMTAMVSEPEAAYHRTALLSEPELTRVLDEFANGGPALGGDARLPDLIWAQARATPDAVAVSAPTGTLTYAELTRRAGGLARTLQEYGAGPERLVGLLVGRSVPTVVAVLAVLRSGAAYLPMDPNHPDERLNSIAGQLRPVVVLTEPGQSHRITTAPVLALRDRPPFIEPPSRPTAVTGVPTASDNLAYVISTSGSTGTPKHVGVTHHSLVNSTLARTQWYRQAPAKFLLVSSLVFDSSIAGLFWPLCTGGAVYLPTEGSQLEPARLLRHIAEENVTHTLAVPSLLSTLLEQAEPAQLSTLEVMIAAGEASTKDLHAAARRVAPAVRLVNEYGPTEATVWATAWTGEPIPYRTQLPIGQPVAGVRAYALNSHGQPVPIGVPAELLLGGTGVARGYLGRPGRTAARFLPDPFAARPGARMYRTGDLARHRTDGQLEFLGRTDHQVKIRGFRVELGEIEGVLDTHPAVSRAVVVARADGGGDLALVAYVAVTSMDPPDAAGLQQYLRDRLPKYMVPATIVRLDALPLTGTGKVDRSALPAVDSTAARATAPSAPRTDTEQVIAAVWGQVLGVDAVGADDDFFDLGGESLRAMQVVTRTNKVFGLHLPVRTIFDASTVTSFAEAVDRARAAANPPATVLTSG
ncbi:amino acid adenylation domain-containing protein [Micromonospora sp. NPDC051296]|uniref:amino acid adenylation domain-containing protein n=1 Tax=Micromonospora sp. NPDC051296 TaxID=3155046 RepID=UPI00341C4677